MIYLKSMLAAFNAAGKSKAQAARDAGVDTLTLRHYMRGDHPVPQHRRAKLCTVLGVQIDWAEYEADYAAAKAARDAADPAPVKQLAAGMTPRLAPAPKPAPAKPAASTPKVPASAKSPLPAPTPARTPEKAPVRRFFGIPIIDDTAEAHA